MLSRPHIGKKDRKGTDSERPRWLQQLQAYFITGLVALAPSVITIYIILELFFTLDGWLNGLYSRVPWLTIDGEPIPGLGVISLLLLIILTGVVAKNFLGGQLFRIAEAGVLKIPMIRGIYNTIKQLGQAFFGNQRAIDVQRHIRSAHDDQQLADIHADHRAEVVHVRGQIAFTGLHDAKSARRIDKRQIEVALV